MFSQFKGRPQLFLIWENLLIDWEGEWPNKSKETSNENQQASKDNRLNTWVSQIKKNDVDN